MALPLDMNEDSYVQDTKTVVRNQVIVSITYLAVYPNLGLPHPFLNLTLDMAYLAWLVIALLNAFNTYNRKPNLLLPLLVLLPFRAINSCCNMAYFIDRFKHVDDFVEAHPQHTWLLGTLIQLSSADYTAGVKTRFTMESLTADMLRAIVDVEAELIDELTSQVDSSKETTGQNQASSSAGTEQGSQTEEVDEAEKAARLDIIRRCIVNLIHASQCRDANCRRVACHKLQRVINHTVACKQLLRGDGLNCAVCKQLIALCCYHAKTCTEPLCPVLFCNRIRQQLQS
ncbi:hypothetical protein QR680_010855 [Steinernema hermaphroditum]|uniref:histone acetyltransferase n=1 Tax=Steinernema hermaphroditum TaxID=289476 RepID=A0AA39MBD0_9BILA|nr:hypothetical protein QR680_010855 [Steinernema hermaphroditum]